jgi:RimJ/RimL family protein N-acetyltransferase
MTTRPPEQIFGDGVVLRRWQATDVDAVFAAVSASLEHLVPWMPWAAGYSMDAAQGFTASVETGWSTGDDISYAVLADGEIVGAAGLHRRIGPGGIEIGYWLRSGYTGRGLATRAVAALTAAAFDLPDIDRVEIHHDAANDRSAGVPARLGFIEVSRAAREPEAPAEIGVEVVWRITRTMWAATAAPPTKTTR